MQVDVRHALAHHFVQGEERTFGPQCCLLGGCDPAPGVEERSEQRLWQRGQRRVVKAGDDEGVAVKDGMVVQEGDQVLVLQDAVSGQLARQDEVEDAVGRDLRHYAVATYG